MRIGIAAAVCLSILATAAATEVEASIRRHTDIAAQGLDDALHALARDRGIQLVYLSESVRAIHSPGAVGELTVDEALRALLSGSGLDFKYVDSNTVGVFSAHSQSATVAVPEHIHVASGPQSDTAANSAAPATEPQSPPGLTVPIAEKEVVVVGSRLGESATDSPVPVSIYNRAKIDESGASSVTGFLNTLPEASVQYTANNGTQLYGSGTTVQLHGLPAGTTLVLINGRRLQQSTGSNGAAGVFDLNQIPLEAIDRIEVMPSGSSAIYGGDGLGGVVNVVLKKKIEGISLNARYAGAADSAYHETQFNLATGWSTANWSLAAVGYYGKSGELYGSDRALTNTDDHTAWGGVDNRTTFSNPGNVCSTDGAPLNGLSASCAGIPRGSSGIGLTPADFAATTGQLNRSSRSPYNTILPPTERYGAFLSGTLQITSSMELFTELLYNHERVRIYASPPFGQVTVPASNSFNPFGQDVTIDYQFTGFGRRCYSCEADDFFRPLLGLRGSIANRWQWEVAAWTSRDWENGPSTGNTQNNAAIDAAVADGSFNPFADGNGASPTLSRTFFTDTPQKFRGGMDAANGYIRGPVLALPSGTVEAVLGAEYERDMLSWELPLSPDESLNLHRENEAAFGELKIPLVGPHDFAGPGDVLSTQLALRYDHYSDFGGRTSPEASVILRPVAGLMLRAAYSSAFKPPTPYSLYAPLEEFSVPLPDPLRGGQSSVADVAIQGNSALKPETGTSKSVGFVLSPPQIETLQVAVTGWFIRLNDGFATPTLAYLLYNPDVFAGFVTRAAPPPGDPYPVGPITRIQDSQVNFGFINEAGIDYSVKWTANTRLGSFSPALALTQTYRYQLELTPGMGPRNAVSQANDSYDFTPRVKGTVSLGWKRGAFQLGVDGRYIGKYRDVTDLTQTPRELGNFWYADLNGRVELGSLIASQSRYTARSFVAFGARNLFNKMPPYSDANYGYNGYDPTQYDIEGRYMWVQVGTHF